MTEQKQKIHETLRELGVVIKAIRKSRKLSRAEFGNLCGIAEKTVQNIEKGNGFTMESFMLILTYTSLDRQLFTWFREHTKTVNDLI